MNQRVTTRGSSGFSLVESMVALAVLSVGLLGAASMLLDSLRTHAGAVRRLKATHLVRDMADRIRANTSAGAYYDTRTALIGNDDCAGRFLGSTTPVLTALAGTWQALRSSAKLAAGTRSVMVRLALAKPGTQPSLEARFDDILLREK